MFAKKGWEKNKSTLGFGQKLEKTSMNSDYVVFPKLEDSVQSTLVPSSPQCCEENLSEEIYGRLDQIYGFPAFNYEPRTGKTENTFSSLLLSEAESISSPIGGLFGSPGARDTATNDPLGLSIIPPFQDFQVLHIDPLVLSIRDFFTPEECDRYISISSSKNDAMESRSPTVGKDAAAKAQRTSTTWYHHFENVPELMAKASRLLGLETISRWEEPQTVRYRRNEKFTWHLDALGPLESKPETGGQRIATLLVYLTDLEDTDGGATIFRDLGVDDQYLRVRPQQGSALLFFPAAGGIPGSPFDIRTLHCGEVVSKSSKKDKWIAQLWLRESSYAPTAPPENSHNKASESIIEYAKTFES